MNAKENVNSPPPNSGRATILVVDDNPTNLKLAVAVLESEGYRVVKAMDAEEALAIINHAAPDLILMDIALPGMDGLTLTRLLRADPATKHMRIVAMTAFAMKGDDQRAIESGCNGYIPKPIDTRRLPTQVAEYLEGYQGGPLNVLIVDDIDSNRKLLRLNLQAEGLHVIEAGDGAEALAILERRPVDAIISDILMPTMDGYRFCYQVRTSQRFQSLPFIFYSNTYTSPSDEKLAMELGADRFIPKPAAAQTLLEALAEITGQARPQKRRVIAPPQELELMKQYSQLLVSKLEEQNAELRQQTIRLQEEETRLCESERRLRTILDSEPECVKVLAADGTLLEMNRAGLTMIEADSAEQVVGRCLYPLVTAEYRPAFESLTERVFRGESGTLEFEVVGLKGQRRWLETNAAPLLNEAGQVTSLLSITRDITEHKRAEAAQREQEIRLQLLVRASNIGLWAWNLVTNEVFLSREWKCQLGYSDDEVPNRFEEWERRVHPDDLPRTLAAVADFHAGRRNNYDIEFRLQHKDGSWRWIMTRADLVRDAASRPIRMLGCHVDITERKRAEQSVHDAELQMRRVLDTLPAFIGILKPDGTLLDGNRLALDTFGFQVDELIGRPFADIYPWNSSPAVQAKVREALRRAAAGEIVRYDEELPTPTGQSIVVDAWITPIKDEAGRVTHLIPSGVDITARIRAIAELAASRERLAALSRQLMVAQEAERRRIACELHDELGQVLTAVNLNLQMAKAVAGAAAAEPLDDSLRIVDRAIEQVRSIALDLRPSLLDDFGLESALRWYLTRQSERSQLPIRFASSLNEARCSPEIETVCFRVAQEAVTNVVRHARASQVNVGLQQEEGVLELVVTDDGIGFDATAARRQALHGGSIGVLSMEERVQSAGGIFHLTSAPGRGTIVRVRLPLRR